MSRVCIPGLAVTTSRNLSWSFGYYRGISPRSPNSNLAARGRSHSTSSASIHQPEPGLSRNAVLSPCPSIIFDRLTAKTGGFAVRLVCSDLTPQVVAQSIFPPDSARILLLVSFLPLFWPRSWPGQVLSTGVARLGSAIGAAHAAGKERGGCPQKGSEVWRLARHRKIRPGGPALRGKAPDFCCGPSPFQSVQPKPITASTPLFGTRTGLAAIAGTRRLARSWAWCSLARYEWVKALNLDLLPLSLCGRPPCHFQPSDSSTRAQ